MANVYFKRVQIQVEAGENNVIRLTLVLDFPSASSLLYSSHQLTNSSCVREPIPRAKEHCAGCGHGNLRPEKVTETQERGRTEHNMALSCIKVSCNTHLKRKWWDRATFMDCARGFRFHETVSGAQAEALIGNR